MHYYCLSHGCTRALCVYMGLQTVNCVYFVLTHIPGMEFNTAADVWRGMIKWLLAQKRGIFDSDYIKKLHFKIVCLSKTRAQ